MRGGAWKVSAPQNVCIFCSTQFQNASVKTPLRPQQRLFASTSATRKPPAGAAIAQKRQNASDQEWAAWTAPSEVFQQQDAIGRSLPTGSSKLERRSVRDAPRASAQHIRIQEDPSTQRQERWSLNVPSHPQGSQSRNGRNAMPYADGEEQSSIFRKTITTPRKHGSHRDGNIWQGLQRRVPKDYSGSTSRSEEQMRRLEDSNQHEFVRLEGLQTRERMLFQDRYLRPTNSLHNNSATSIASNQPQEESVASFHYPHGFKKMRPHSNRETNNKASSYESSNGWSKYEPRGNEPIAAAPLTSNSTASASSVSDPGESERAERTGHMDLESHRKFHPREPASVKSHSASFPRRSQRRSEIYLPLDRDRTTYNRDKDEFKIRQIARRRGSIVAEDETFDENNYNDKKAARRLKMQRAKEREKQNSAPTPILLPEFISVSNLAGVLRIRAEQFLRKMDELGFEGLKMDHVLDAETAGLVASEYNYEPIIERSEERDLKAQPPTEDKSTLPARPPVVTIMGHVDHGKTTLLDFLRKSSVAASEHGGITQHIGAFSVRMSGGRLVTFLDTPGHAAFLSMRQRGANVTDIVVLVVAADDSVKPQTIEAIKHAQSAKVPIIVAINKIDKEDARPDQAKQDLARYGVEIEDFGGDTQVVCVSGKTGQGMAELEDAAVALADILDMRAATDGLAEGWILEATTKRGGRVATVLVRRGTLRPGDVIVAGSSWARVRSLRNEAGVAVDSAGPGTPIEIDGWRDQPSAGDEVLQSPNNDERKAKNVIEYRLEAFQREQLAKDVTAVNEARRIEQEKREQLERAKDLSIPSPEDAADVSTTSGKDTNDIPPLDPVIFFILKADVSGSVEAVENAVSSLGTAEIRPHILRSAVGPVNESDIEHAAVAAGHIINFNTPVDGAMARLAKDKGVRILDQSIIYRLTEQVKGVLEERLVPIITAKVIGEADIAMLFNINIKGRVIVPIAGCKVRNGVIEKGGKVRVLREGEIIFDGSLSSLKNVKKDITEARKGMECGLGFEGWTAFKVGDQVQHYEEKSERRKL